MAKIQKTMNLVERLIYFNLVRLKGIRNRKFSGTTNHYFVRLKGIKNENLDLCGMTNHSIRI